MKVNYHNMSSCIICGGINNIKQVDSIEGYISECETVCTKCNHKDYWAYGFYMSTSEPKEEE